MIKQNSEKPEKLEELLATYHVEFFGGHPKKLENFHLMKISEEKYEISHPHLRAITKDRLYVDPFGNFLFSEIQLELDETHPEAQKLAILFPFGWQGRKLYVNQEGSLIRITKSPYQTKKRRIKTKNPPPDREGFF